MDVEKDLAEKIIKQVIKYLLDYGRIIEFIPTLDDWVRLRVEYEAYNEERNA